MDKCKYFENQVKKWCKLFGIKNISVRHDAYFTTFVAYAYNYQVGGRRYAHVGYTRGVMKTLPTWKIIHYVFHEIGHLTDVGTSSSWKREYNAEKFALSTIQKYFPQYYTQCVQNTRDSVALTGYPAHTRGFSLLLKELGG